MTGNGRRIRPGDAPGRSPGQALRRLAARTARRASTALRQALHVGTAVAVAASATLVVPALATTTAAPAAAATQPAWSCSTQGFLFQAPGNVAPGSIYQVDIATGAFSKTASTTDVVNATGYNVMDNYVYGWDVTTNTIVRVGSDGSLVSLGLPAGVVPSATNVIGDVDSSGHYWMMSSSPTGQWYEIDLVPGSATYGQVLASGSALPPAGYTNGADWAFVNGSLYMVDRNTATGKAALAQFSLTTHAFSIVGQLPNVPGDSFGAVYAVPGGYLFASDNQTGEIYRINVANAASIDVNTGPASSGNDGARCALAPVATLTLTKSVAGRVNAADQFKVGLADPNGALTSVTTTGANTSASTTNWPVSPGTAYSITDAMAAGSPDGIGSYSAAIACTDRTTGATVTSTGPPGSWSLTPSATHDYACTITNTPAGISIVKHAAVTDSNGDAITDSGDSVQYTFTVTNTGMSTLTNVTVNDTSFSGSGSFPAISCPSTTLTAGQTETCTATGVYAFTNPDAAAGVVNNSATATGTKPDGTTITSAPSTTSTPLVVATPALSLVKTATPTTVTGPGQSVAYSFVVKNTGNVDVSSIAVNETAFSGTGTLSAVTCAATDLAPGASTTCTATYTTTQADVDAGKITNTAVATGLGAPYGSNVTSAPSSATVTASQSPSITIVKAASPASFSNVGNTISYSFLVTNTGNVTLNGVGVNDTQVAPAGALTTGPSCPSSTLAPGASETCTATYTVAQADLDNGSVNDTATASGTSTVGTKVTSLPSSASVPAVQSVGLSIVKTATPTTVSKVGDKVTYSFVVANNGNVTLNNVAVTDTQAAPAGALTSGPTCPTTTLAPGASTTCTATYLTTQADLDHGTIKDSAVATGTTPTGGSITTPPSSATVTVNRTATLSLVKTATPAVVSKAGDTVSYSFAVSNTGNVTLSNVAVAETAFSGTGTVSVISCPVTTLAPGASTTCTATYAVTQADVDAGSVTNTAVANGTDPSGGPVASQPSSATVTAAPASGLTLVKTATPAKVGKAGDTVSYSFVVANNGNVTLSNVGVNETAFTGTGTMSAITCPVTTLVPGASTTCTATYTFTQADVDAGKVTNTATATGTTPGGSTVTSPPSSATVTVNQAATLSLVKSASPAVVSKAGDTVSYSFAVTNNGNTTVSNVAVNETAFSGTGTVSAITCPATTLAPGASTTCTATYAVTQADVDAGSVTNTAVANGTDPSGGPVASQPSSATVTANLVPGLSIVKTATPAKVGHVGDTVTYSFLVSNNGNITMSNVAVQETAFSGTGTMSAITCPTTTLAPGQSMTCTATYTFTQADVDAGKVSNTATATGNPPPGTNVLVPPTPPWTVIVPVDPAPVLSLVKTATPAVVSKAGDTVGYSFAVTNNGNVTLNNVGVNETAFTGTGTVSAITCPVTTLAPGASTTCTATYAATQADVDAGSVTNTAVANGTDPSGGPVASQPSSATVTANQVSGLTLVKTATPAKVGKAGDTVTYSFLVANNGNTTVSNVAVNETAFTGTGTMSAVTCPVTTLAPGASTTCTVSYTFTQADVDAGKVTNTAVGTGTTPRGSVTTPPSTFIVTAPPAPALSVLKTASPAAVGKAGDVVSYSFAVTNTGNVTLSNVGVNETAFSGTGTVSAVSCPVTVLAPGASTTCTASYTVTQADVDAGSVSNTAVADGTDPSGGPVASRPSSATVTANQAASLKIVKSATPSDAAHFTVGQVITYSFAVSNTGNVTMTGIQVHETQFTGHGALSPVTCPAGSDTLAPGASMTCTATYTLTQADVDAGKVTNEATATGNGPGGGTVTTPPSHVDVPGNPDPALTLVKTATPSDPGHFTAGQVVTYSFTATNTGNVTVTGVKVAEGTFTGHGTLSPVTCPAAAASLAPGASVTCTATYTITAADVAAGSITNEATATGNGPAGGTVTSPASKVTLNADPVATAPLPGARVETGGTVVHPGWPVWFWALLTAAGLSLAAGTAYTAIRRRKD
ncbi:beta strand repeat-containing protein [Arthrobacter bambusae]|uniref:Repeat protein (TIGR01451 family) n=1 Tax=Arthrobacter bambusae TaxID=1338426 RepID=A0AAW8DEE3_9MICC|nr:choice-of-anchor D domain-containing protein [Arthrobacter bambusae]MDP9904650.1 putative repeat protein (TIGR01451 family) [Arthrobacter bambusae]MDQ0129466.1 putative repeat protein (TIGR01451 family) [Arthrobacter bambusae]MDQ0180921.1 putative repeat protein (TIGR01451 family) [Arthrobacter bambusae]